MSGPDYAKARAMPLPDRLEDCALSMGLPWDQEHKQYVFSTLRESAARMAKLEAALKTFAEFAVWTDENGWTSTIHREPISVWFGPSDFRDAAKALRT